MHTMTTYFAPAEITYTGEQLRSLWAYRTFDILGDSAVGFIGPCDVQPEQMRDLEDLKSGAGIYSERMLHFIIEHFDSDLEKTVWRQWIFMTLIVERLNRRLGSPLVVRQGSDLYERDRKLTVSIATVSPISGLIHVGINVSSRNTPVPTRGLTDLRVDPCDFGRDILAAYAEECRRIARARCKVRACP